MRPATTRRLGLASFLPEALPAVAAACALGIVTSLLTATLAVLVGSSLREPFRLPVVWLATVVVAMAATSALSPLARGRAAAAVRRRARRLIYGHLLEVGPAVHDTRRTGDLAGMATDGVERVGAMVGRFFPLVARATVVPVVVAVWAIVLDPWVGTTMLVLFPAAAVAIRGLERSFRGAGERLRHSRDALAADFLDALQGLTTLKLFGRSAEWADVLASRSERVRADTMSVLRVNQRALIWVDLVYSAVSVLAVTGMVWWRLSAGALDLAEGVTLVLLAIVAIQPLVDLVSFFYLGALGLGALRRIGEVADLPPRARGATAPDRPGRGELRFEAVTFAYGPAPPVVHDLSLTVTPGTSVALVGRSGSGKSTLASLALGLRTPARGKVTIDAVDVSAADPAWLSRQITYVGQSTHLFAGTVAANLRVARPEASLAEMVDACRRANLIDTIERLPAGFDTLLGERGFGISGGEAQRLAIARALLTDAPVLILDEATSALDLETEDQVTEAVHRLMSGRTVVVIAHRLTTVRRCHRVVELQDGSIVADGPPDDLDEALFRRTRQGRT